MGGRGKSSGGSSKSPNWNTAKSISKTAFKGMDDYHTEKALNQMPNGAEITGIQDKFSGDSVKVYKTQRDRTVQGELSGTRDISYSTWMMKDSMGDFELTTSAVVSILRGTGTHSKYYK